MADKYDFSDSNTTFLPESARGSLHDRIASQTDANMGRRRVYLNNEEWQEYQSFKNNKMFDHMISGMQPEDQDIFKEMYGRGEYISPDEPRSYDDIKWKKGPYAAEGEIRFANGYKLMVCKVPEEEGIKVLSVVNRKTLEELPLDVIRGVSEAGFKPQHNYSVEQIEQLISLVQKVKGSYYPQEKENTSAKSGISPLMPNRTQSQIFNPNFFNKIEDIDQMMPNDLLKINNLSTSAEERRNNESLIQRYNEENKVENDTADFSKLKWGRELTLAPIQAKDGSTTYVCSETAQIPLENGNTISIVKKENGTYSYLTKDKDNNVISASHNMKEEDVADILKLEANNLKKQPEKTSHTYRNIEDAEIIEENLFVKKENLNVLNQPYIIPKSYRDIEKIDLLEPNNLLIIGGLFTSVEEQEYNNSLIQRYNDKNKIENDTADFSMLKWGKELTLAPFQAFDGTQTYICYETAQIPLENGNTIKIVKNEKGNYSYFTLDKDNKVINSSFYMPQEEVAYLLKLDANNIKKQNENASVENQTHTPQIYRNLDNIDRIGIHDQLIIPQSFDSEEPEEHNKASINKYNEEHKVENNTANFDELKWGTRLVEDTKNIDRTITYVCVESADIPLVEGLSINVIKKDNGFVYSLLYRKEVLESFYTVDKQALADTIKSNRHLIPKQNRHNNIKEEPSKPKEMDGTDAIQRINDAIRENQQEFQEGLKKLGSQFSSLEQYIERVKRRQQEFLEEKEGIAPKTDDSKKFSKTNISKEDMAAYIAKNSKQNQ